MARPSTFLFRANGNNIIRKSPQVIRLADGGQVTILKRREGVEA